MKSQLNQNFIKRKKKKNFMILKNHNLVIFQSPFQTKVFLVYRENIFADCIFYIAPIFSYKVFITRIYVEKKNKLFLHNFLFNIKK